MTEHSLSVTLKGGTGFDSPWIVVYGDSPSEVEGKLREIGGVVTATIEAANALKAANNAAPLLSQGQEAQAAPAPVQQQTTPAGWGQSAEPVPTWAAQSAQPQAPQQSFGPQNGSPHPEGKQCQQCGQVVQYKAFTSKAGKPMKLWTCPNQRQRGDGHASDFIN